MRMGRTVREAPGGGGIFSAFSAHCLWDGRGIPGIGAYRVSRVPGAARFGT